MKTKNLVIIFILFLLLTIGGGLVVFFTGEKKQPILNEASKIVDANNQPAAEEKPDQTVKSEPIAETTGGAKSAGLKPIVQPETTVSSAIGAGQVAQVQAVMLINGVEYRTTVKLGSSVYDLMSALKEQKKIDFKAINYSGLGFFVEEINGIRNNPPNPLYQGGSGENWLYYVNSKRASVGISNYKIKANDVIEWKYEKKSF